MLWLDILDQTPLGEHGIRREKHNVLPEIPLSHGVVGLKADWSLDETSTHLLSGRNPGVVIKMSSLPLSTGVLYPSYYCISLSLAGVNVTVMS